MFCLNDLVVVQPIEIFPKNMNPCHCKKGTDLLFFSLKRNFPVLPCLGKIRVDKKSPVIGNNGF